MKLTLAYFITDAEAQSSHIRKNVFGGRSAISSPRLKERHSVSSSLVRADLGSITGRFAFRFPYRCTRP